MLNIPLASKTVPGVDTDSYSIIRRAGPAFLPHCSEAGWMVYFYPMDEDRYYLETLGCQMNERDSETIAAILEELGLSPCEDPEDARVAVINTCSVREKPEQKVYSRLGEWNVLKQERPGMVIAVCGCMAQVAEEQIRKRAPYVDIIAGPRALDDLKQTFARHLSGGQCEPTGLTDETAIIPEDLPVSRESGYSAHVNVTYGCDNFCAYCIVPHTRGREVSRQPEEILAECRNAVSEGYPEITLLGQNVNSYGHDLDIDIDFPDLLEKVGTVADLKRLRFTTSHPKDCSTRLLETMADIDTVCEHLHLPVQAGNDEVLRRMGRGYTAEHFRKIVQQARELMPGMSVTTDVMVGFPGETAEQFDNTLQLFEQIRFDQAFMFKYDDRPGTRAAEMSDKIPEEEKQRRLVELIDLQNRISRENNEKLLGQNFRVLVEGPDDRSEGCVRGRTRENKIMIFPGPRKLEGNIVTVTPREAFLWGFRGELAGAEAATTG